MEKDMTFQFATHYKWPWSIDINVLKSSYRNYSTPNPTQLLTYSALLENKAALARAMNSILLNS